MKPKTTKVIVDWILTIVITFVLSLGIRTYIAEAAWIPSGSMIPTLKIGDHIFVNKIAYHIHTVERGDIVVFTPPKTANLNEGMLIKRVIGLPKETILIKSGIVYINDVPLSEPYEAEKPKDDFGPYTVPDNTVFVMGDNRNSSYDSRFWGALPINNITGKAQIRYYPLNEIGILTDF